MRVFLMIILGFLSLSVISSERLNSSMVLDHQTLISYIDSTEVEQDQTRVDQPKLKKLKAVLLAIFLGHFGVHRIYLGTSPNVPVVYSLTLGGGLGLLPLIDAIAILVSKDLEEFSGNNRVFMWIKKRK